MVLKKRKKNDIRNGLSLTSYWRLLDADDAAAEEPLQPTLKFNRDPNI